jgi:hypothetical protein
MKRSAPSNIRLGVSLLLKEKERVTWFFNENLWGLINHELITQSIDPNQMLIVQ